MSATNFLTTILEKRRQRVGRERAERPLESLRVEAFSRRHNSTEHALRAALRAGDAPKIIAEFKRASPSKGSLSADARPAEIARLYEAGGAAAVSVLTEEEHFRGSLNDLRDVRAAVTLPILRKDFIVDEYQIYETATAGASALLLIVAALDDETLAHFLRLTEEELGMDALVEVHTAEEMRRARACGATLIGVNNRDLSTFKVSLDVSVRLAEDAPRDALLVSESGLRRARDIQLLRSHGYKGFLIGETLMRAEDPAETLHDLINDLTAA
ncbi:MAG TPA: indole-3-glycerol phosphate synthase TrpC [Pyrinomonadaceae bacterium]|nr:indole-3-glycerol phosphate synthase TrpC [Pyrinomonadaceae bacterium]